MAEACSRVMAMGKEQQLSIGCIPSIASHWLVPNLNAFTSQRPNLDVRVVYARADQRLADGGLDALITFGAEPTPGVQSDRVLSRISRPVASRSFLEKCGPFESPSRIAAAPLLHDESRDGWRRWFRKAGVEGVSGDTWPVYQDFNLLVTAAIAGHGVALCPVEAYRTEIERGDLVVLSDVAIDEDAAYYISYSANARPAVNQFVHWFLALIAPI